MQENNMQENNIQDQLDQLNNKVDLILDHVNQQRLKANAVEDLVTDLSIISTDMYKSAVKELEDQDVAIEPEELRVLGLKLIRNIKTFNNLLGTLESVNDFISDASPIANEMIIDVTRKLHEFEQKGYFEFMHEMSRVMDNIITHFSKEDVRQLADNIVTIMETVKNITQPEMLNAMNNVVKVYGSLETGNIPEYSIFRVMREMRKPEMKRSLGFLVTFLKNLSKNTDSN